MKVFITADIEGVTGINNWDEAAFGKSEYNYFREQMNREVLAACEGALAAGATKIVVRDAHGASKNIDADRLPRSATLIRGWSGHPYSMVQGIDSSFSACLMIGYHARAGAAGNPLAHTMSTKNINVRLNNRPISEFVLHALACELEKVPTCFVAGDQAICEEVKTWSQNIGTVMTTRHLGQTTETLAHPKDVLTKIQEGVQKSLSADNRKLCHLNLNEQYQFEIEYREPHLAYRASFYPGMELINDRTVRLDTKSYYEVLRAIQFC